MNDNQVPDRVIYYDFAFIAGDLFADENLDGRLDLFDNIQSYLGVLAAGCP